ncbi:hypothetical protein Pcinc_014629 [Petrolisthes cinctipes]|uniref:Uncharacterized protein n=1 Tax=Petrolisthes cinctipes TaxID=88211 RepID=A0AAE1FWL5_PETCI|nr:hypothetical protein Pcinc_014629 [Petrolisthes cinctipes]
MMSLTRDTALLWKIGLQVLAGLGVENKTRRLEEQLRVDGERSIRVENQSGRPSQSGRGVEYRSGGTTQQFKVDLECF